MCKSLFPLEITKNFWHGLKPSTGIATWYRSLVIFSSSFADSSIHFKGTRERERGVILSLYSLHFIKLIGRCGPNCLKGRIRSPSTKTDSSVRCFSGMQLGILLHCNEADYTSRGDSVILGNESYSLERIFV